MTAPRPLNSEPAKSDFVGSPEFEPAENATAQTVVAQSNRSERRRLIRAAVASVPVVLTFTAGKARAQEGSPKDSSLNSDAPNEEDLESPDQDPNASESEGDGELTPAEKLETFGLQRAERPEGYSEDPFRDLDTVSEPVDLNNP